MMKMATGDGFPLRQGAGTGSRLVFGGYRGLRRRNSRSRFLSGGFRIYKTRWRREQVRGTHEGVTSPQARPGGWARLPGSWLPRDSSPVSFSSGIFDIFHKNHGESFIPFGLRLIFLSEKGRKIGKNKNWHWALGQ